MTTAPYPESMEDPPPAHVPVAAQVLDMFKGLCVAPTGTFRFRNLQLLALIFNFAVPEPMTDERMTAYKQRRGFMLKGVLIVEGMFAH